MRELNFITIGDKKFFSFVNFSIKQVFKFYPNSKLFLYDWGLTLNQRKILKSYLNLEIIDWSDRIDWKDGYKEMTDEFEGYFPEANRISQRQNEYLYVQKVYCLLDCVKRIKENLIYIDGDAFIINPIDEIFEMDFEVGVTLRRRSDIEERERIGIIQPINAGVIFFKANSEKLDLFIKEWIRQIKITKRILIEQTALALLLERDNPEFFGKYYNKGVVNMMNEKIKIMTFPCEIYNLYDPEKGFNLLKTKIIHIKGNVKNVKEKIIEFKLRYFFDTFLKIIPKYLTKQIRMIISIKSLIRFVIQSNKVKKVKKTLVYGLKIKRIFKLFRIKN